MTVTLSWVCFVRRREPRELWGKIGHIRVKGLLTLHRCKQYHFCRDICRPWPGPSQLPVAVSGYHAGPHTTRLPTEAPARPLWPACLPGLLTLACFQNSRDQLRLWTECMDPVVQTVWTSHPLFHLYILTILLLLLLLRAGVVVVEVESGLDRETSQNLSSQIRQVFLGPGLWHIDSGLDTYINIVVKQIQNHIVSTIDMLQIPIKFPKGKISPNCYHNTTKTVLFLTIYKPDRMLEPMDTFGHFLDFWSCCTQHKLDKGILIKP